jgi:PAS domain S-box-containing protein
LGEWEDVLMDRKATYEELEQRAERLEKAVQKCEEQFRAIAGAAKDAIVVMDNEGNISYWNEAAEKIFGYSAKEVLGKELHLFLAPEQYHDAYKKGIAGFKRTGGGPVVGKTLELETVRKDGTSFPIELSVSAVKIDGKWHATGIVRDISERKEVERELWDAQDRRYRDEKRMEVLRLANEMALELMHELRTPLVAIGGFSARICDKDHPCDKLRQYTRIICEQSMRLEKALNGILVRLKSSAEQV